MGFEHKQQQLCRQVQRHLEIALYELGDPSLSDVYIADVQPEPAGPGLSVSIAFGPDVDGDTAFAALAALRRATPRLRQEIAHAIHRKRTPPLHFRFIDHD